MNSVNSYFKSSIGRKQIVASAGLLLILFFSLIGNVLNLYASETEIPLGSTAQFDGQEIGNTASIDGPGFDCSTFDINQDGKCDQADLDIYNKNVSRCGVDFFRESQYFLLADMNGDGDGCLTEEDVKHIKDYFIQMKYIND